MAPPLTLTASDYRDAQHWYWRLVDAAGALIVDHEVELAAGAWQFEAMADLAGYLRRNAAPDQRREDERQLLQEVGAWMEEQVLGPVAGAIVKAGTPTTVRVVVPEAATGILYLPLELTHCQRRPLALQDVSLVFEVEGERAPIQRIPVGERLRMLAVFSQPTDASALNLRQERYELKRQVLDIARERGLGVDLQVLQYGVTRQALQRLLEDGEGWDILHFSGHGLSAHLVLEQDDGSQDLVPSTELIELLKPARGRLKWVTLSACLSAATTLEETLQWLGIGPTRQDGVVAPEAAETNELPAVARALVRNLDCAVLAMRYPVGDEFAIGLGQKLYSGVLEQRHPLSRALQLALASEVDRGEPLSVATPALFGAYAAELRIVAPSQSGLKTQVPMAHFPSPSPHFVGRMGVMVRANQALARRSGQAGVLFHGMAGAGKTACALELAHLYEDVSRFTHFMWWEAPEAAQDDVGQALLGLALAMEQQLPDLEMVHRVDDAKAFLAWLPEFRAVLGKNSLLLVLDNLETLVRANGEWRDPRWAALMEMLAGSTGISRVVMTSRIRPQLGESARVLELPVNTLSLDESALLARRLPHLSKLLRGEGETAAEGRALAKRTLLLVQGHPKLIELCEGQAASAETLGQHLERAARVWVGGEDQLRAFFEQGESTVEAADWLAVLSGWTGSVVGTLPETTRTFFEFLCSLEESDRQGWVVEATRGHLWTLLGREETPPELEAMVAALTQVGLVEAEKPEPGRPASHPGEGSVVSYRLHPGVAAVGRDRTGEDFQAAVDTVLSDLWVTAFEVALEHDTQGAGGQITAAGRCAAPYLLRRGEWETAAALLEQVIAHDSSPESIGSVMPLLRHIAEVTRETPKGLQIQGILAKSLHHAGRWQEAEEIFEQLRVRAVEQGEYGVVTAALGGLMTIQWRTGRSEQALSLMEEKKEATRRAGLGPWTQLGDEGHRLQLLAANGGYDEVLAAVERLRPEMDALPKPSDQEDPVPPWNVYEGILSSAHTACLRLQKWKQCLSLNADIIRSMEARGASALQIAGARSNDCSPLLRLERYGEARRLLDDCRRVFEQKNSVQGLGAVFGSLAALEHRLSRRDRAIGHAQNALRYGYMARDPDPCAGSHFNLAEYLQGSKAPAETWIAHYLAAALLAFQTASGRFPDARDMVARELASFSGAPPIPEDFASLCALVEEVEGVRFRELFEALPCQRAADGDDALQKVLELVAQVPAPNTAELPEALRKILEALASATSEAEREGMLEELRREFLAHAPERAEEIEELLRSLRDGRIPLS